MKAKHRKHSHENTQKKNNKNEEKKKHDKRQLDRFCLQVMRRSRHCKSLVENRAHFFFHQLQTEWVVNPLIFLRYFFCDLNYQFVGLM